MPFDGVKVAFIEHDGFLVEILQGDQVGFTNAWWGRPSSKNHQESPRFTKNRPFFYPPMVGLRVPSSTKNRQKITKNYQDLPRIDHFLPAMVGIADHVAHGAPRFDPPLE